MLLRTASSHATTAVMADHGTALRRSRRAVVPASQGCGSPPRRQSEHRENPVAAWRALTSIHCIVPFPTTAPIERRPCPLEVEGTLVGDRQLGCPPHLERLWPVCRSLSHQPVVYS